MTSLEKQMKEDLATLLAPSNTVRFKAAFLR